MAIRRRVESGQSEASGSGDRKEPASVWAGLISEETKELREKRFGKVEKKKKNGTSVT